MVSTTPEHLEGDQVNPLLIGDDGSQAVPGVVSQTLTAADSALGNAENTAADFLKKMNEFESEILNYLNDRLQNSIEQGLITLALALEGVEALSEPMLYQPITADNVIQCMIDKAKAHIVNSYLSDNEQALFVALVGSVFPKILEDSRQIQLSLIPGENEEESRIEIYKRGYNSSQLEMLRWSKFVSNMELDAKFVPMILARSREIITLLRGGAKLQTLRGTNGFIPLDEFVVSEIIAFCLAASRIP